MQLLELLCALFYIVEGVVSESCSRTGAIYLNNNVKLSGSTFETITGKGQTDCARKCKLYGRCKSYNYHMGMKICELNFATADTGGLVESEGFIHTNIDKWPDAMVLTCASHDCKINEVCVPGRKGYTCLPVANALEPMPKEMINAWQSSTYGLCGAENAIDGITTADSKCHESMPGLCAQTNVEDINIWSAQFSHVSSVYRVVLYLRVHPALARHQNYTILVGRTSNECVSINGVEIGFYRGPPADYSIDAHTLNFTVANPPVGKCLIVKQHNDSGFGRISSLAMEFFWFDGMS